MFIQVTGINFWHSLPKISFPQTVYLHVVPHLISKLSRCNKGKQESSTHNSKILGKYRYLLDCTPFLSYSFLLTKYFQKCKSFDINYNFVIINMWQAEQNPAEYIFPRALLGVFIWMFQNDTPVTPLRV